MIVPILKGGLGNQMFQISCAYAYAKRHGFDFAINYNLSTCPNQGSVASKYKDTLYKNIPSTDYRPPVLYSEPKFSYTEIPIIDDNILFDGYFQTDKYFIDCENEIRYLFTFPEDIKDKVDTFLKTIDSNTVGIHIRRGDYISVQDFHVLQKPEYYMSAASLLSGSRAIICTDDINSVNNEMKFSKAIFSPFKDELEDMYLLSQCKNIIICNSSFSWWSAFLGKHDKVIAPIKWFGPRGNKDYYDIYRVGWICL